MGERQMLPKQTTRYCFTRSVDVQLLLEVVEVLAEVLVGFAQVVDRTAGVENRSVVLATAVQTNVGQRTLGHLLGEVHGDLTRLNDLTLARLGLEQLDGQVEVIAHHFLDVVDADFAGRVLDKLVNHLLGEVERDGLAVQAALRDQADERTFQFANVRIDRVGEVLHDFTGQLDAIGVHLLFEDGHPGLEARHLNICTESPLESGEQALFHALHLYRRLVAGQDNLLARLMEVVEDVEEHILRLLLAAEELHVIHDEDIHELVEVGEVVNAVVADRIDELVRELFGVHIEDRLFRSAVLDLNADGMRQVGLAQSDRAVNQQGIEGRATWLLRHCKSSTARQAVALSLNEVLKAVLRIEVGIDVELLEPWNDKGVLDGCLRGIHGHLDRTVAHGSVVRGRHLNGVRGCSCGGLLHDDGVLQAGFLSQFFADGLAKQFNVMLFKPLVKELRRHLYGQYSTFELHSFDGNKPRFESLRADIVFDKREAIRPDAFVIQVHAGVVIGVKLWTEKRTSAQPFRDSKYSRKVRQKKGVPLLIFSKIHSAKAPTIWCKISGRR